MAYINRRRFMQTGTAFSFLAGAGTLGALTGARAYAADTSGYKALVCVFLFGGMDHADTILPMDDASHNQLKGARSGLFDAYNADDAGSSRNRSNWLELSPANSGVLGGRRIGLPPQLAKVRDLFAAGDLSIMGNVGPLIEPTTRSEMESSGVELPARLFSHNDQQSIWMSFGIEGSRKGWGGQFADAVLASSGTTNPVFTSMSTAGNAVFLSGETSRPFQVAGSGPKQIDLMTKDSYLPSDSSRSAVRALLRDHLAAEGYGGSDYYTEDIISSLSGAITNNEQFLETFNGSTVNTDFPSSGFGQQLKTIARTINIQSQLGVDRQVFFASMGGFDTHSNQTETMPKLHARLADGLAAFNSAMKEIGMHDAVTLFTASDFGRTTIDNGDGTDHGWGGHQFMMGGAVNGGRIYGEIPDFDTGAQHYTPSRGRLIPSTSVDQFAATLGKWFGLSDSELTAALPNIGNFDQRDLGFMS